MTEIIARSRVEIEATTAEAWAVVADRAFDVRWVDGLERTVQAPSGLVVVGADAVAHIRFLGRRIVVGSLVESVEPGHRFTWRASDGADVEGSRLVSAARPGFVWVELRVTARPRTLIERLTRPFAERALQRSLDRSLQRLEVLFDALAVD